MQKMARKIVNCYRVFTKLREAWPARGEHSTRPRISSAARTLSTGVQFLFETSDLTTGVTPKAKRQKTGVVKMKLKELS